MSKKIFDNENANLPKPKVAVSGSKVDRFGSKTAPIEADFSFDVIESEENSEYIGSYNYYIYYHSIKPKDPRLPKPTYKPMPDMEFIKKGNKLEYDTTEHEEDNSPQIGSFGRETTNINRISNYDEESGLDTMIGNLNINDKFSRGGGESSSSYFDYIQSPSSYMGNFSGQSNMSSYSDNFYRDKSAFNNMSGGNFQNNYSAPSDYNYYGQRELYPPYSQVAGMDNMNNSLNMGNFKYGQRMDQMNTTGIPNSGKNNFYSQKNFENFNDYNMNQNYHPYMNMQQPYEGNNMGAMKGQMGGQMGGQIMEHMNNPYSNNRKNNFNNMNNLGNMNNMGNMRNLVNMGNMNNVNNMGNMNNVGNMNSMGNLNSMGNTSNMRSLNNVNNMSNSNIHSHSQNMNPYGKNHFNNTTNMNSLNNSTIPMNPNNYNNFNPSLNSGSLNSNGGKKGYAYDAPSFNEVLVNLIELSRDHAGSRLVQKKYEESSEEEKQKMFDKLFPEIYNLTKDVFGNYVIQKLLEHSSPDNRKLIITQIQGRIYELTMHMYGCRVIQKAIEVAEVEETRKHLNELKNYIKICIEDQNGNHVIQKLIEKLPKGEHKDILNIIKGRTFELSTHQYGCRVIQRIFEYCNEDEKELILSEVYQRVIDLCQDQYGNYVIQHIIERMGHGKIDKIFADLKGRIFDLSIHKFASNAVEKCLAYGNTSQRKEIIDEIISKDDLINDSLLAMVKDKYGNYVVQKMIEVADNKTKENIVKRIISSQSLKKRDGFSKHVINFIEKMGFSAMALQQQNYK